MKTGKYKVYALQENQMKADGGLVFGAVPKSVWSKAMASDNDNKVSLGINQFLISGEGVNILIDTGVGTKLTERHRKLLGLKSNDGISKRLQELNLYVSDITHVILTHLHYDHAGGLTKLSEDKEEILPVFPNAQYYIQRGEWESASNPDDTSRALYKFSDFLPLVTSGKVNFIKGNSSIIGGLSVLVTGGHTENHQMVILEDTDKTVIFPADICPTQYHLTIASREAFDLFPADTLKARTLFVKKALKERSLVAFSHSQSPVFFKVTGDLNNQKVEVVDVA